MPAVPLPKKKKVSALKLPGKLASGSRGMMLPAVVFGVAAILPDVSGFPPYVRWLLILIGGLSMLHSMRRAKETVDSISTPLAELVRKTRMLAEGDPDQPFDLPARDDEFGELTDAFRRVIECNRRDRHRLLQINREMHEANERAITAKQEVESYAFRAGEANAAKREFLAVMSHEIRTPVNGIIGMTELAMGTDLSAAQRDYLETINSCAESLLALLNNILDFSKIEAGKLELERTEFSLRELLGEALTTLAPRAHGKGLELLLHIRPEVPDMLIGDPHRLRQIVVNFVGNALKFTERGEVMVRVENSRWVDGAAELAFAIADTGIGIPSDRKDTIFQAFSQADYSTTRRFGGTGLGLAITQQLVALMGGDIKVDSEEGKGTVFRFTALFDYRDSEQDDYSAESFKGLRALVLDAHPNSLRITTEILTIWEMEANPVRDVMGALSEMRRAASEGKPYDLLIADAVRPESPGVKLASTIDSYPELVSTRVVLLVSSPRRGEIDRYRHAAIRATLIKPVTARSLRVAVSKALQDSKKDSNMSVPKASNCPPMRPLEILVAEDNAVNQRLVKLSLEGWGHKVTLANDGLEAVKAFSENRFDLVLTDLQMPNMSGFEATAEIRQIEKLRTLRRTPILALSANVLKGVRDECAKSGMDGYVSKPVRQQELLAAMGGVIPDLLLDSASTPVLPKSDASHESSPISAVFKLVSDPMRQQPEQPRQGVPENSLSQQLVGEVSTSPLPEPVAIPVAELPMPEEPKARGNSFDAEALMSNLGGEMEILTEVVKLCREADAPRLLKDLGDSLSKGDCVEVGKAAHGIKGMVGAFSATDAWAAAKQLETSGREGKQDVLRMQADELVQTLRILVEDLEKFAGLDHQPIVWG